MKIFFSFLTLLVLGTSLKIFAADNNSAKGKGQIGITFSSFGSNDLISFAKTMGGPGYHGEGFKAFGLAYVYKLNETLDFETGIEYSYHKIIIEPNLPLIYHGTPTLVRFSLINIPATIHINFLRYFFLNSGLFLGFGGSNPGEINRQNGIGINIGLGLKYEFRGGFSLFVNPYTKVHSLIPLTSIGGRGRLIESGFRFGFLARLNK